MFKPAARRYLERAQSRLCPAFVLAAGLGAAAACFRESLATPGALAEGVLLTLLLTWAIFQVQAARRHASAIGRVNQRLNEQMGDLWRAEQALRSSEARFQAFMDNSQAVAYIKDESGRYVYLNEPFARRFLVDRADWLNRTVWDTLPESAAALHEDMMTAWKSAGPSQSVNTIPTPDDPDCRWLSLRFPFQDSAGRRFLGCVAVDVSVQQRAVDQQRVAAEKLSALVEASPLAIFSFDRAGLIQSWSRAAERLFGWQEEEIVGRRLPFVSEDKQEESQALIARLLAGETFTDVEVTRCRRDGSPIEITISAAPLRDASGHVTGAMALVGDITVRKKNDEMRVRLEEILTATSDFVGTATPQGRILYHNQAFLTLMEDDRESISGKTIKDFYPAWAKEMIACEAIPTAMRDGVWNGETAFLTPGGIEVPVSQVIIAHRDVKGEISGFSTIARDLTEHKRIEDALRRAHGEMEDRVRERTADLNLVNEWLHDEVATRQKAEEALWKSEQRYRFLADSMPQIVWTSRADGTPDYYNQWWHEYTGLTPDQTERDGWEPAIHPADWEMLKMHGRVGRASGQPQFWEYRVRRTDGTYRWHLGRMRPLHNILGEIVSWVGTGTDIDDFKQSEKALRRAHDDLEQRVLERTEALHTEQEFLRALLNNLQEGILACDADGTLTIFNQASRDFHGLSEPPRASAAWSDCFDLFHADGTTPMRMEEAPLFRALHGEVVRQAEMVIAPQQGKTRTLLASGQAIRDVQGKTLGAVVAMHDITERKAIDRMKTEFISVVSHELRTPLTSIRGALGLVEGGLAGEVSPEAQTLIGIAHSNTERLVRLINDILDSEKIESGEMEFPLGPVALRPLLVQAMENLSTYAGQYGVCLTMDASPEEFIVRAESERLTQVLTNLLSNAAKFSPPGETVHVGMERRSGMIRVTVRDRGPGIPPEFQDRIFQKFAQADVAETRTRGGTGLGLSICKALVERLDGQIGFESRQGPGTTFYVDLQEQEEAKCLETA